MESGIFGRATRTTVFVALFIAVMMMVGPALRLGDHHLGPANSASAQTADRVLRAGWSGFAGAVKTLNPLVYTMGQESAIWYPCYSFMLTYDENGQMIGDLTTKYTVSPDGLTWHFWIVHTASFYDKNNPATQMPLTVDDVIFTFWLNQNNTGSYFNYFFPTLPGTGGPIIQSMTKINDYEMEFHLRATLGPFISALTGVPIVPKYIWQSQTWNWPNFAHGVSALVGSGFMYYGFDDLKTISNVGQAELYVNPTWFGTKEYGWQSHVYKLIIKSETDSSAILDYKAGNIDVIIAPTPQQYTDPSFPGTKFASSQGFVLDLCINQLTLADRIKYNIGGPTDWNSQILQDPAVKYALKAAMNKTSVVQNSLLGGGSPADSLMPGASPWVYHYGSTPGEITIPNNGDTYAGRMALMNAGWKYRSTAPYAEILPSAPDYLTYYPLAKVGGTEVLSFRFFAPDSYTFFDDEARRYQIMAENVGIFLDYGGLTPTNTMNVIWATADYDVYLWDWWFSPNSEPSLDVMEVMTSSAIGGSSDANDDNATYDALYFKSLTESDPVLRKAILDDMQRWAYLYSGYWPVAYRDNLYGAQTAGPTNWHDWGNWATSYTLTIDNGFPWLFSRIWPENNPSPQITQFTYTDETDTSTNYHFTATVTDTGGTELLYRWNFGDGNMSAWSTSASAYHQYATDGYYNAYFMVKENNTADGFISHATEKLKVIDISNLPPTSLTFTMWPSDPDSGTIVYVNGTATDPNGDPVVFTWNFGDGSSGRGQQTTHQFSAGAGLYTVYMYADDNHLGVDPRPVHTSNSIQVTANVPPTISVRDEPSVPVGSTYTFRITANDTNTRDHLKFTWVWGDGSESVTTTQTCDHVYAHVKVYTLVVWADDQTGLPGHNVSDSGQINVYRGNNHAPYLVSYSVSNAYPTTDDIVYFYANAVDDDGDVVQFTFDFGDGYSAVVTQVAPNSTVTADHVYLTGGISDPALYFPTVTYTDMTVAPITAYSTTYGWWMEVMQAKSTLSLLRGWNFVTVSRIGWGYNASTLGLLTNDVVSSWNPATQKYDKTFVVNVTPLVLDFAIQPSTGYWIYAGANETLNLYGYIPTGLQARDIMLKGGAGWAIIGLNSLSTTRHASDIPPMYTGQSITTVAKYNTATGKYTQYATGVPPTDFALAPGEAYWIYCTLNGTLTYTP